LKSIFEKVKIRTQCPPKGLFWGFFSSISLAINFIYSSKTPFDFSLFQGKIKVELSELSFIGGGIHVPGMWMFAM
jgi:hypothetical protein